MDARNNRQTLAHAGSQRQPGQSGTVRKFPGGPHELPYSMRNASTGSMLAARRAGRKPANAAASD